MSGAPSILVFKRYARVLPGSTGLFGDGAVGTPSISFSADPNTGLYRTATDELSIATGGVQRWKVDAGGRLATTAVSTATHLIDARVDANDGTSGSIRLRNLTNDTGAYCILQFASGTGGGSIGHYPAAHTAQSSAFQDRLVIRADADSTGLMLAALSASQVIEMRVATTGTILSVATGALTIADNANLVFSTGTGTKFGTAANQKLGKWGVTPIVQPSGWTAATGTATRTTFATGSVTLPVLAEHVKALIDDLLAAGNIGA